MVKKECDKPLLVGELNPYGMDPGMALYPLPEHASGGRLARILGLSRTQYLRAFDRANLCTGRFSPAAARERAHELLSQGPRPAIVLLGARVQIAFGMKFEPFTTGTLLVGGTRGSYTHLLIRLPHPSGRNRSWSEPGAADRARRLLREHGVLKLGKSAQPACLEHGPMVEADDGEWFCTACSAEDG